MSIGNAFTFSKMTTSRSMTPPNQQEICARRSAYTQITKHVHPARFAIFLQLFHVQCGLFMYKQPLHDVEQRQLGMNHIHQRLRK